MTLRRVSASHLSELPMNLPQFALGGDLIWWRESDSWHTLVTLWGGRTDLSMLGSDSLAEAVLLFRLYEPSGEICATWTQTMRPGVPVTVDSRGRAGLLAEGVLAIIPTIKPDDWAKARHYRRLFSMVDWYSEDGELVSLHSDHSLSTRASPIEFTEIVFLETSELCNFLVLINGGERQKPGSVNLQVRNQHGEVRSAVYIRAMEPFSLHKLNLNELFSGLCEFCDGKHATLEGMFDSRGVFNRPTL